MLALVDALAWLADSGLTLGPDELSIQQLKNDISVLDQVVLNDAIVLVIVIGFIAVDVNRKLFVQK